MCCIVAEVTEADRLGQSDHTVIVTKIQVVRDGEEEVEQGGEQTGRACDVSYKWRIGRNRWRVSRQR